MLSADAMPVDAPERTVPAPALDVSLPSVLTPPGAPSGLARRIDDDAWHDLALDQVEEFVARRVGPELAAVLRVPLATANAVRWRQDVFRALAAPAVRAAVEGFRTRMGRSREALRVASRTRPPVAALHRLAAIRHDLDAEEQLGEVLGEALAGVSAEAQAGALGAGPRSEALDRLAAYASALTASPGRRALRARADACAAALDALRSSLWIQGPTVTAGIYDDEPDDVAPVLATFARFADDSTPSDDVELPSATPGLDHVEEAVLVMVRRLHPEVFDPVEALVAEVGNPADPVLARFDDEVRFFLAVADLLASGRPAGLDLCLPDVGGDGALAAEGLGDVVLALHLADGAQGPAAAGGGALVTNDVDLRPDERLAVITGPNQGGKTTTARSLGQLHHLASVGCPVGARAAHVPLTDAVLTHFERPERLDELLGRLGEDLTRLRALIEAATPASLVVLNEAFASTPARDATYLSRQILDRIAATGARCVCVTFLDELATHTARTVSWVLGVDAHDPERHTFRLARGEPTGRAQALTLAARHGLTPAAIAARIGRSAS